MVCLLTCRLAVDEEDEEDEEDMPDWTKAASSRRSIVTDVDCLSHIQQEAMYIPRSTLRDFIEIGEGISITAA